MKTIELGKPFDAFPISQLGIEGALPHPSMDGLDVVIMLSNLQDFEIDSIIKKDFIVGMPNIEIVTFLVFKFGCLTLDLSLNVFKIVDCARTGWLHDDSTSVRIYLVRSEDGVLVGTRNFQLNLLSDFKRLCEGQLKYSLDTIDKTILYLTSVQTTEQLYQSCSKHEVVKAPDFLL